MAGTRAPRRSRGRGGRQESDDGGRGGRSQGQDGRIKFGVAWINPDNIRGPILDDLLGADGGKLSIAVDDDIEVKAGTRIYAFPNDNDNPKAPAFDLIIFTD